MILNYQAIIQICKEKNKTVFFKEDLSELPIFLGILFEKFLNLMSAKKSAQLHSDETREIFTAFDMQGKFFSPKYFEY